MQLLIEEVAFRRSDASADQLTSFQASSHHPSKSQCLRESYKSPSGNATSGECESCSFRRASGIPANETAHRDAGAFLGPVDPWTEKTSTRVDAGRLGQQQSLRCSCKRDRAEVGQQARSFNSQRYVGGTRDYILKHSRSKKSNVQGDDVEVL